MLPCFVCRVWPFIWPSWCPPPCQSWWPCPAAKLWEVPAVAFWFCFFLVSTPIRDWWIDCVAAASVSVPRAKVSRLRVGIPAMAPTLGLLLLPACRGPWGAGGPGTRSDSHTAVTPLETQQHSPYEPLWSAQTKWLSLEIGETSDAKNSKRGQSMLFPLVCAVHHYFCPNIYENLPYVKPIIRLEVC